MCGFVYNFWFTCKKGSVKSNHKKKKKKKNTLGDNKESSMARGQREGRSGQ